MKEKTLSNNVQSKIDEAKNALEKAFQLLEEAKVVAEHEDTTLREMQSKKILDLSKLESIMDNYGWSSSSLYC